MSGFRVSNEARTDIVEIGRHTQREWGVEQRRLYLFGLEQKFIQLSESPKLSAERPEFEPPVRIHHHKKHLIVYVVENSGILIIRVLHESMDIPAHIPPRS